MELVLVLALAQVLVQVLVAVLVLVLVAVLVPALPLGSLPAQSGGACFHSAVPQRPQEGHVREQFVASLLRKPLHRGRGSAKEGERP